MTEPSLLSNLSGILSSIRPRTASYVPKGVTVPEGARFSCGPLNYRVEGMKEGREDGDYYYMACELPGVEGNRIFGQLIPAIPSPSPWFCTGSIASCSAETNVADGAAYIESMTTSLTVPPPFQTCRGA